MAGKKRKATDNVTTPGTPTIRRQSGRVVKSKVNYIESDREEVASDCAPNDIDAATKSIKGEDSFVEEGSCEDLSDDAGLNAFEKDLKMKGYTRKRGKGGKWEMVIELPKEKDDGGISYEDNTIHPNTMNFLKTLKKNNQREWLKFHDALFRQAEKDFFSFVGELSPLVSEKDPTIPELPIKDIIYRIYRDVRFSADKTPYKTYFSVTWSRTGRKGPYAHYYLHIQPGGGSFFGGGYYGSDNLTLACIREDIDQQPHQLKSILMGHSLRNVFFPDLEKDEKMVVASFCKMSAENALKVKPKGYNADHQDISLLKLRNFILQRKISDDEITSKNALGIICGIVEALEPFITYLNSVVMPDRQ